MVGGWFQVILCQNNQKKNVDRPSDKDSDKQTNWPTNCSEGWTLDLFIFFLISPWRVAATLTWTTTVPHTVAGFSQLVQNLSADKYLQAEATEMQNTVKAKIARWTMVTFDQRCSSYQINCWHNLTWAFFFKYKAGKKWVCEVLLHNIWHFIVITCFVCSVLLVIADQCICVWEELQMYLSMNLRTM